MDGAHKHLRDAGCEVVRTRDGHFTTLFQPYANSHCINCVQYICHVVMYHRNLHIVPLNAIL